MSVQTPLACDIAGDTGAPEPVATTTTSSSEPPAPVQKPQQPVAKVPSKGPSKPKSTKKKPAKNPGDRKCFICKSEYHMISDCPQKKRGRSTPAPAKQVNAAPAVATPSTPIEDDAPSATTTEDEVSIDAGSDSEEAEDKHSITAKGAEPNRAQQIQTTDDFYDIADAVQVQSRVKLYRACVILWSMFVLSLLGLTVPFLLRSFVGWECRKVYEIVADGQGLPPSIVEKVVCRTVFYALGWAETFGVLASLSVQLSLWILRVLRRVRGSTVQGESVSHALAAWARSDSWFPPLYLNYRAEIGPMVNIEDRAPADAHRDALGYPARQAVDDVRVDVAALGPLVHRDPLLRKIVLTHEWVSLAPLWLVFRRVTSWWGPLKAECVAAHGRCLCLRCHRHMALNQGWASQEAVNDAQKEHAMMKQWTRIAQACQSEVKEVSDNEICSMELVFQLLGPRCHRETRQATFTQMWTYVSNEHLINVPRTIVDTDVHRNSLHTAMLVRDKRLGYDRVGFRDASLSC